MAPAEAAPGEPAVDRTVDMPGELALPRRNGELVFEAPWESRAFGIAVLLHRAGAFEWSDFQARLIAEIRRWEAAGDEAGDWHYYELWARALEGLLVDNGLVGEREIVTAVARGDGHDH